MPSWVPLNIDHPIPATDPMPAVLTAASTVHGSVITPNQAAKIVLAIWNLRNQAFDSDSPSFMAEFETGPALESDEVTCECNSRGERGDIKQYSLFVPKQASFPATFLAEVKTTLNDAPYVQYLVIARQSMAIPWKVVSDPGESVNRSLDLPKMAQGFDDAAPISSRTRDLPSALATYWHTWTEEGHAPVQSPFASGPWTTRAGATYAKNPSGSWSSQNGLQGYYSFQSGAQDEVWTFETAAGPITCGVVRWQTVWSNPGGGILQDSARRNWGISVLPGVYQYEAETQIIQPCFVQHPGAAISVVSGQADPDTEQGVNPLPATPTTIPPISQV